jgi:hypothetical protein
MYMKHIQNRGFAWAWSGFGLGLVCVWSGFNCKESLPYLHSFTPVKRKRRPDAKREDRRSFRKQVQII